MAIATSTQVCRRLMISSSSYFFLFLPPLRRSGSKDLAPRTIVAGALYPGGGDRRLPRMSDSCRYRQILCCEQSPAVPQSRKSLRKSLTVLLSSARGRFRTHLGGKSNVPEPPDFSSALLQPYVADFMSRFAPGNESGRCRRRPKNSSKLGSTADCSGKPQPDPTNSTSRPQSRGHDDAQSDRLAGDKEKPRQPHARGSAAMFHREQTERCDTGIRRTCMGSRRSPCRYRSSCFLFVPAVRPQCHPPARSSRGDPNEPESIPTCSSAPPPSRTALTYIRQGVSFS